MKFVSVIVPVYNVENYIESTIKSILAQTYKNFELLIIDDQTPDNSIEICKRFQDPRIHIIHQKNRGLAGARNTGIRHAKGDYLAFLDSDDLWQPDKLQKHVEHLNNAPAVGVSFSRSAFIDAQGQELGIYQMPKLSNISEGYLLCRNPIGNGSAPVIRRQVFAEIQFKQNRYGTEEVFFFDEEFRQSEDIECWIRIGAQTSWKIEGIPDALTLYRVNTEGLSAQILKQYDSWNKVIEKTRTYAPELVQKWENPARAFQLRYLARRAVRMQDSETAVQFVHQAIKTYWPLVIREPRRTLLTLVAAYMMLLFPSSLYKSLERKALLVVGSLQRRRISKDKMYNQVPAR